MKKNVRFYKCSICGNIVGLIEGDASHLTCCCKQMDEMIANITDASLEKHVPVYERMNEEIIVRVGELNHPMENDHYIMWIAQVTDNRTIRARLFPGQVPEVKFPYVAGSTLYAYCNKHGLWQKNVD